MIWDQRVTTIPGVGPKRAQLLAEMGLQTIGDLALNLPSRYLDASQVTPIAHLQPNTTITLHVTVETARLIHTRSRQSIVTATVSDASGKLPLTFFHQPYIIKKLPVGEKVALMGNVSVYQKKLTLINPTVESLAREESIHTGRIIPIYRQHETLKAAWLRQTLFTLLKAALPELSDSLPDNILRQEQLMPFPEAIWQAHFPDSLAQAEAARRRLAFAELWDVFVQLREQDAARRQKTAAAALEPNWLTDFYQQFQTIAPFPLTASQQTACQELMTLLTQTHPDFHLVQGEVGSGKTLVAAFVLLAMAAAGHQALYLAPTTVLAQQHYQTLSPLAAALNLSLALWTGQQKSNQTASILIGTHALLHQPERFLPGIVVIDEEHRFGVRQRGTFWEGHSPTAPEGRVPHLVSLTATPIPRTLAHALYGSHTTSYLQPIPGQEKQITTRVFDHTRLIQHFAWLQTQIATGAQVFLITPFINASEAEGLTEVYDAQSLYQRAEQELPQARIALLTGQTKPAAKQKILNQMQAGKLDVLVATPVIEVGIDIPHASIMTIFSAERFGLAQLHQLRGRVGRRGQESWCFLVPSPNLTDTKRLVKLTRVNDGSQLAEIDLQTRGVGEFLGTRQSGWDTLRTADWLDLRLIEQVKRVQDQILA